MLYCRTAILLPERTAVVCCCTVTACRRPSPEYTKGLSKEACRLLFTYLPRAYKHGANDYEAREKVRGCCTCCHRGALLLQEPGPALPC